MDKKEKNIKTGKNICRKITSIEITFHIVV